MHDADQLCDRVAFIVEGQIKHIDSPRNMKQQFGERTVLLEQRNQQNELIQNLYSLDSLASNKEFHAQLSTHPIDTLHSKEASLEDVFIKVTGASLV
jgi:fluoroquinolone transport system ATP-binding protein